MNLEGDIISHVALAISRGEGKPDLHLAEKLRQEKARLRAKLRRKHQPNHTHAKELGQKRRYPTVNAAVVAVLDVYPKVVGGIVEGSSDHQSFWFYGKLVAHCWSRYEGGVWLRLLHQVSDK